MAYDPNLGYDPSNIAQSINEAAARGDDAEVERLAVARYQKLQSDPALMAKYGNDAYSQVAQNAMKRQGVAAQPDTTVAGAVTQPAQQQTFPEMMQWIDALTAQQKQSALAGLESSRQAALSSLSAERKALTPTYAAKRQQIASTGDVEAQRMNEFLAAQGLARSGAAGTLQGRVGAQTTGQLAQARQSEAQALQDILRRQTEVEQQYQTGLQQATSAAEAARIQALIEQARADRQYGLQEASYTGVLPSGQLTLQGQEAKTAADTAAQDRELASIGQFSGDFMAEIQRRQNTADTTDDWMIPYLTAARNQKIAAQNSAKSEAASENYDRAFKMFQTLGTASGWVAEALGLPEGATTEDYMNTLYNVSRPYYKPSTGTTSGTTENQRFNQLMDLWDRTGIAPAGLEAYGIAEGTPKTGKAATMLTPEAVIPDLKTIMNLRYDSAGTPVGSYNAEAGYNRLQQLLESKQIDEATAEMVVDSIPELGAYVDSLMYADRSGIGGYGR